MKEEIFNEEEVLLDVTDEELESRLTIIKKQLEGLSEASRKFIPNDLPEHELVENKTFKSWIICNEILQASERNPDFARLLYFLYDKSEQDINRVLSFYDIEFKKNEKNEIVGVELISYE